VTFQAFWNHDLAYSFRKSPVTVVAAALTLICVSSALLAPWIAPYNPFDAASLDLNAAFAPPAWIEPGSMHHLLGTDDQGRDMLSTILYGARISLGVAVAAVLFALTLGIALGLVAGYLGGRVDAFIMRVADIQLSFPAILIALLVDGVARVALPGIRTTLSRFRCLSCRSEFRGGCNMRVRCVALPWWKRTRNTFKQRASSVAIRLQSCCATCCRT